MPAFLSFASLKVMLSFMFPLAALHLHIAMAGRNSPAHIAGHHTDSPQSATRLRSVRKKAPVGDLRDDLRTAINVALGAGNSLDHKRLQTIRTKLWPMWQSLAKNEYDRVDRRSLRYAVHRYLLHWHSISVIGLEPLHANGSHDEAEVLTKYMPAYVRTVLEGQAARQGFSIDDAVAMIVALERLVQDSPFETLEAIFQNRGYDIHSGLNREQMMEVLEDFMIRWMLGDDIETILEFEAHPEIRDSTFEDWPHIAHFAKGRMLSFEHSGDFAHQAADNSWNPFVPTFSFGDAQAISGGIAMSFGRFWETECVRVKASLVSMDHGTTGRVKLSDFHGAALAGEWRFSESKDYLRELGALDESSRWHGPQVIITNYLQSPSNCIVYSPHYRVCCANECEDVLGDIEASVASPLASPEDILRIVSNITASLEDDAPPLCGTLTTQLHDIARASGGKIPIHGRLFTQWLHYAYPHQCSFPHKSGTTTTLAPLEYGLEYMASSEELEHHAGELELEVEAVAAQSANNSGNQEDDWMSQWSHEEELLTENLKLTPPWESTLTVGMIGFFLSLVVGLAILVAKISAEYSKDVLPTHYGGLKTHLV